jgi:hypothetical protein
MKTRLATSLLASVLLATAPAARAQMPPVPPWYCSLVVMAAPAGSRPVLFDLPDGTGAAFTQARVAGGSVVDATITLTVRDSLQPWPNRPAADFWLEREVVADGGSFAACFRGTIADAPTDALGVTHWTLPLRAGGWSSVRMRVMIWGQPLTPPGGEVLLDLRHNSADLNGDLAVDLADVPLFAADYLGGYAFRSDLLYDGVVDLSDVPRLASALGTGCP